MRWPKAYWVIGLRIILTVIWLARLLSYMRLQSIVSRYVCVSVGHFDAKYLGNYN